MKARSRLKATETSPSRETSISVPPHAYTAHTATTSYTHPHQTRHKRTLPLKVDTSHYLAHVGTLFFGLIFGALTILVMNSVSPKSIENILFPHSYLPFQMLLFLSVFFLSSFLWLNSRRGYLTALALQTLVFLKLQNIILTWQLVLGILAFFVIIEILFTYLETHRHASFKQKSQTRHRRVSA